MPGRPKSDTKKKQLLRELEEEWRHKAIAAYSEELLKPEGKRKGARTVARDFTVQYKLSTGRDIKLDHNLLIRGAKGGRTRAQANAARNLLTDEERKIVIQFICECGDRGFPLSHRRLHEHVTEILRARLGDKFPIGGVGVKWTHRFVEKYSDQIKMSWSSPLESKRGRAVNDHTAKAWFDLVERTVLEFNIVPETTHGTDEVGTNTHNGERERVMGAHRNGPQYQQRNGTRENITTIVTICADGSASPPAVIFKGQAFQVSWRQNNPANAS